MLVRHSEQRPATGGLGGDGALNLLGRPELNPLVVLIREAVQNSWDARAGDGPVAFEVATRVLSQRQRQLLREAVLTSVDDLQLFRTQHESAVELNQVLASRELRVLTLTDRGTRGLGGPLRADMAPQAGERTDFVDLVFNVGQPNEGGLSGGTYGFGKTIAYLVSSCHTVLIHSRTRVRDRWEDRFIAQAIGHQYRAHSRTFTGRHWWGVMAGSTIEPLTGSQARDTADRLGLPYLGPEGGTTIAIIAPLFEERSPEQAMTFIANAIAWNFWPKMVADGEGPAMSFSVSVDGRDVPVPDPTTTPPLDAFVAALRLARRDDGQHGKQRSGLTRVEDLRSQRPKAHLGRLALVKTTSGQRPALDEGTDEDGRPLTAAAFEGRAHHVALMRQAELVVRYLPGPELQSDQLQWAGVFRASAEADRAFADAEPPTHDEWRSQLVSDSWDKRKVNVALREIRRIVADEMSPKIVDVETGSVGSPVLVAERLGGLISPAPGSGAARQAPDQTTRAVRRAGVTRIEVTRQRLTLEDGVEMLQVDFSVDSRPGCDTTVVASATVAVGDGGSESDPPAGAPVPKVLWFERGGRRFPGKSVTVPAGEGEGWTVAVAQPPGTAIGVDLRPVDGDGESPG